MCSRNQPNVIMKKILLLITFTIIANAGRSQIINCGTPFSNFGLKITYCGDVKEAKRETTGKKSGLILFMCASSPNQEMTIVLKDTEPPVFTDPPEYWIGKQICVNGKVQTYQGKYFMAVKKKTQMTVY